jgi:hypothetical protein
MKKFTLKKKMIAGAAAAALTLGVGGAAVAFFTASGSGTGSGSVGTASNVTITGTAAVAVTPDGTTSPVSITVTNPGTGAQTVGAVSLASVTPDAGHSTCVATVPTVFSMADTAPVGLIAGGASASTTSTLVMHDTGLNQDPCQGATLTLGFTSN